jgi:hypothetical protein
MHRRALDGVGVLPLARGSIGQNASAATAAHQAGILTRLPREFPMVSSGLAGYAAATMPQEKFHDCIEVCQDCIVTAEHCVTASLRENHPEGMARAIELNRSCAAACAFTVGEMVRDSFWVEQACQLCADICESCADESERHDFEPLRASAIVCRSCAEECRRLVATISSVGPSATWSGG